MEVLNIPGAAGIMNFVVLVAALSAMNSQLYISTRIMFSLSRAGFVPKILGKLNRVSVSSYALVTSALGIAVALIIISISPESAFGTMMSITSFGALYAWFMIFLTHLFFRKEWEKEDGRKLPVRMIGYPYLTISGTLLIVAITVSTWFTIEFKGTLILGIPWLIVITVSYFVWKKYRTESLVDERQDKIS